jgi:hypothetical protein
MPKAFFPEQPRTQGAAGTVTHRRRGDAMLNKVTIFIPLLCLAAQSLAQDASFSVTADRTTAAVGEQIQITAALVSQKKLSSVPAPQVPHSEDFNVAGTNQNQSTSTSIQIVNGRMTQNETVTYSFYYVIVPRKAG